MATYVTIHQEYFLTIQLAKCLCICVAKCMRLNIKDLQEYILVSKKIHDLEGITFLGGEPFLQANSLKHIAKFCKEKGLSVMCFSGFKYERLKQNVVDGSNKLLTYLDVLIDGPYIDSLRDNSRNWVGSSNQTFYYLSNYYNSSI